MAADGYKHKEGGLNKKRVGDAMQWAESVGIVSHRSVWKGKNCPVLRTSEQLRRSLKPKVEQIITALQFVGRYRLY